jgi:hypothetical protein
MNCTLYAARVDSKICCLLEYASYCDCVRRLMCVGVYEHAHFLRDVSHAAAIRSRIIQNLGLASTPGRTQHGRQSLLHIVVVGGGPTGVEVAGEIVDFVVGGTTRASQLPRAAVCCMFDALTTKRLILYRFGCAHSLLLWSKLLCFKLCIRRCYNLKFKRMRLCMHTG